MNKICAGHFKPLPPLPQNYGMFACFGFPLSLGCFKNSVCLLAFKVIPPPQDMRIYALLSFEVHIWFSPRADLGDERRPFKRTFKVV